MSAGQPMRPQYNAGWVTSQYADPANRGKDPMLLVNALPSYSSWDQALADPRVAGMGSDAQRTAYLQDLYGLGGNYGVRNGQIVSTDHSLRNGLLGGAAVLGGASLLGSLTAPAGVASAGLSTGAAAPSMTTMAGALGGAAVPGATGAGMGALDFLGGLSGLSGRPSTALSLANLLVPTGTNLIGNLLALRQNGQASAMTNQYQQQALELARQQQAEDERRYRQAYDEDVRRYADTRSDLLYRRNIADTARSGLMALLSPEGQMAWRSPSNVGRV
jgi:hypothetical protein